MKQDIDIETLNVYVKNLEGEFWLPLKDYETRYFVSNFGRIFSTKRMKILKPFITNSGQGKYPKDDHLNVELCNGHSCELRKLHIIIAETFLEKPCTTEKICIHHINSNPQDNRVANLIYVRRSKHIRLHRLLNKFKRDLVLFDDNKKTK